MFMGLGKAQLATKETLLLLDALCCTELRMHFHKAILMF